MINKNKNIKEYKNMSNFELIGEFNRSFGVTEHDTPQLDIIKKDPELIKYRLSLITEEYKELVEALENNDYVETVDALSDILYVVYGMGRAIGIDLDKAFSLVHKSNMSKLCKHEDEAKQTVGWYKQQYELGKQPYDSPNYRKSPDGKYWVVYNESTNKILKSINYRVVTDDLVKLCNQNKSSTNEKESVFEDKHEWF